MLSDSSSSLLLSHEMRRAPSPRIEGARLRGETGEHLPPRGEEAADSSLPPSSSSASLDRALPTFTQKSGCTASNLEYPPKHEKKTSKYVLVTTGQRGK